MVLSVVDVVRVLTEQPNTRCAAKYWSVLKKEGSQLPTKRRQLTLMSADRNRYLTDVAVKRSNIFYFHIVCCIV